MNTKRAQKIQRRKRRLEKKLKKAVRPNVNSIPTLTNKAVKYEMAERTQAIGHGGIGAIHNMLKDLGFAEAIDHEVSLLKVCRPYTESDHVLNIAYNSLLGGTSLEDIELRRNDEAHLKALKTQSIPDPTTAGDFCRRFDEGSLNSLMSAINNTRLKVWSEQPESFFTKAVIDADGTLVNTLGECKEGMDVNYKGDWGYAPLLISLANTQEPLFIANRSGNRPSHEGAASYLNKAGELCERSGFKAIELRGDTDFSQTAFLDGWHDRGWQFTFGIDAQNHLVKKAELIDETNWERLERLPKYEPKTAPRSKPKNIKKIIVKERGYKNLTLSHEDVATFDWQPKKCNRPYRIVALRKTITVTKGEELLLPETRYFFFITNDVKSKPQEIVLRANKRCNQENLIEQLKNGVSALHAPVNSLCSNWAYMLMSSLAWTFKAWYALRMPVTPRWKERHEDDKDRVLKMEFKGFLDRFIRIPCQIIHKGRQLIYRVLTCSPDLDIFFRVADAMSTPLRT